MGAGHHHGGGTAAPRRLRRVLAAVLIPLAVLTLLGLVLLWPHGVHRTFDSGSATAKAEVTAIHPADCNTGPVPAAPGTPQCGTATVHLTSGPDRGQTLEVNLPEGYSAPSVHAGDRVVLSYPTHAAETPRPYAIIDHQRNRSLLLLGLLFCAVVIGFGRWRGLGALAGLGVSLATVLLFIMPAIATGKPPLLIALVGSAATVFAAFYLTNGLSVETSVAILGTLTSLVITCLLALVAVAATSLTGFGTEEARQLPVVFPDLDLHGLLLAGIIIASLGILNDVTVSQAATVTELAAADPHMHRAQLYRAAARIGRTHVASAVNTIILAYVGASLPLILLIASSRQPVGTILTSQFVAQEIVQSVVGTIGLVLAVPITTGLAVAMTAGIYPEPAEEQPAHTV